MNMNKLFERKPKKPKVSKPPEDSQFLRMLWFALTITCFYLIALVDPKTCSFAISGFKIPLLFIDFWVAVAGSSMSYHFRHQDLKWPEYIGLGFVALFCWWFLDDLHTQLLAGPEDVDFLLPAVHLVTGMFVSHSFELRTRFDFNFSLAISLIIVCYAATLGKGATFGIGMFVYVVLAATLLLLDCEARTFGKVQARSIDQPESYLTVDKSAGGSEKTANLLVPTVSLLSLSICFFLSAPRAESLADQVAANLNSFVRNNILHKKPYVSPVSRFRSPVNPLKSTTADPDMWTKNLPGQESNRDESGQESPASSAGKNGKGSQAKTRKPFSRAEAKMNKAKSDRIRSSIESANKDTDESEDASKSKGKPEKNTTGSTTKANGELDAKETDKQVPRGKDDPNQEKDISSDSKAKNTDGAASRDEGPTGEKSTDPKSSKKDSSITQSKLKEIKYKQNDKGSNKKKRGSQKRSHSGKTSAIGSKDSDETSDDADGTVVSADGTAAGGTGNSKSSSKNGASKNAADAADGINQSAARADSQKENIDKKSKPTSKQKPKPKPTAKTEDEYVFSETLAEDDAATIRDVPLFNVACNRTVPFRQGAFDNFDGHNWTVSKSIASEDVTRGYDGAYSIKNAFPLSLPSSVLTIRLTQKIHIIKNLGQRIIFAGSPSEISYPGPSMSLDGCGNLKGRWSLYPGMEYTVFADEPQYDLKAMRAEHVPDELEERAIRGKLPSFTQIPDKQPDELYALSQDIAGVQDNWFVQAEKICKYLRSNYIYSDDAKYKSDASSNSVDHFLFQSKIGDCKDFASAFVMLCRASGIPARMVVGFTAGEFDPATGTRVVKLNNYHTWGEIYYPSTGWVPFDATPQGTLPAREKEKERYFTTMEKQVEKNFNPPPSSAPSGTANPPSSVTVPLPNGQVLQITLDFWQLFKLVPIIFVVVVLARPSWILCKSLFKKIHLPSSVHPASKTYLCLQKDLKSIGVASSPSQTPGEFLNKVNDILASSGNSANAQRLSGAVEEFVSSYNSTYFGSSGNTIELEKMRKNIRDMIKSL